MTAPGLPSGHGFSYPAGKRRRHREKAPPGTSPLEWGSYRGPVGELFRGWIDHAELTEYDMSVYLSQWPFQARRGGIKEGWVSQLLTGKLNHAPWPREILGIAHLTGNLFHQILGELGRALGYRLEVPLGGDLREEYTQILEIPDHDDRLAALIGLFEQVREVM